MNEVRLQEIQELDKKLQKWIACHKEQLLENQASNNITLPSSINNSQEYLLYKLRKIRCEECNIDNTFKFIRIVECDQYNIGFRICSQCYLKKDERRKKYVPMSLIISQYLHQLKRYDQCDANLSDDLIHISSSCKYQIQKKIKEMIAGISQSINQIGQKLIKEFEMLVQITSKERYRKVFQSLFQEKQCQCRNSCCHCHYHLLKGTVANCELHDLKQKQDQILKNLKLLSIVEMLKKSDSQYSFMCIYKEFASTLTKHFLPIQNQIKKMNTEISQISLFNLSELQQRYHNEQQIQEQDRVVQKKKQSRREGIVNHLNHQEKFKYPPQIQELKINFCGAQNTYILKDKIHSSDHLSKITISHGVMAEMFLQDLLTIREQQKEMVLLSEKSLKNLKEVSFNCKSSKRLDLLQIIKEYDRCFKKFDLYGDFYENFQQFNQGFHFLKDQTVINFVSPSVEGIRSLCYSGLNKNIWVQFCESQDPNSQDGRKGLASLKLLQSSYTVIQGIMFGHLNGITRKISSKMYELVSKAKSLKTLHLNHINIEEKPFIKLLTNCNNLQAIYINSCSNLSKNCSKAIMKLKYLKKLSLVQVSLRDYAPLPPLQTLIIEGDLSNQLNQFGLKRLTQQSKLKCLSLYNCRELNQSLILEILQDQFVKGADLRSINLGSTKITNKALAIISKFRNLRKLNIGGTYINLHQFMYDLERGSLQNLKNIEQLSLKGMRQIEKKLEKQQICQDYVYQYYNIVFAAILNNFCLLSHLDISCNKVIDNRAIGQGLKYLVYLTVKDTKYIKRNKALKFNHKESSNCPKAQSNAKSSQITSSKLSSIHSQDRIQGNRRYLKQISANAT